jgi:phage/plasmid-associated DNA primase
MTCNKKPTYVDPTNATKRRMRIVPFPVTFCENPEQRMSTEENPVARLDATLKTRVPLWRRTVAAYLLHRYAHVVSSTYYRKFGEPTVPKAVREATDDYDNRCNVVKTWINEELEYADPESGDDDLYRLDQTEAFQAYREWCRLFGHQIKPMEFKEELKHEFKRRNIRFNAKKKAWFGVRLMEMDEDDC